MTQSNVGEMKPRILLVDNDLRARQIYDVLLQHWQYEPVIAQGDGKALMENAKWKAKQERCHLALIDLRLMDDYDEDDVSGSPLRLGQSAKSYSAEMPTRRCFWIFWPITRIFL